MAEPVTVAAHAKLNLYLHVTGRRDDGYHDLESLIAFTTVCDRLTLNEADSLSIEIDGPFGNRLQAGPDNLVCRAIELAAQICGRRSAFHVALEKVIPVAAGLGGGSADAAAAFKACLRTWRGEMDRTAPYPYERIARELGADVPICLHGEAATVSGLGEIISTAPRLPEAWILLTNPGVAVSTADVFRRFEPSAETSPPPSFGDWTDFDTCIRELELRRNDLTQAALDIAPVIGEALDLLADEPACRLARMTGSGPTCFALYESRLEAAGALQRLRLKRPEWWTALSPLASNTGVPAGSTQRDLPHSAGGLE